MENLNTGHMIIAWEPDPLYIEIFTSNQPIK